MAIKSALGRQFGTQFDSVFDVAKSNPIYDKAGGRIPSLDLNFARSESLRDSRSTRNKITFTRASSGTFVGADGLIKTTPVNFALNSNSVQGSTLGTPILNSTPSVVSPRGITETVRRLARDAQQTAQVWRVGSTSGGTPDTTYTISFFAKTVSGGTTSINIDINDISPTGGQSATITGEWTRIVKTGGSRSNNFRFFDMNMRSDTADFYVWGVQIEEGTTATEYIPTGATISGAPRFDHDPVTGESLGLLIEEARTNEISTDIGLTSNLTGASVSEDNSVTKPDGTTGALKITATAGSSVHSAQRNSTVTTTNHAFSVFVKKGNHRYIGLSQGGTSNNIHVIFDTDTKTITDDGAHNNGTFVSSGFEEYANGWFRIHIVGFTQGTNLRVFLAQNASQNGLRNWTATGDEFCYAWGIQREDGNFPTSYIPTSSSVVTRAADVVEITGTNLSSFFNQNEGTMFVEALNYEHPNSGTALVPLSYSDNSFTNLIQLGGSTGSNVFNFDVISSGSQSRATLGNYSSNNLKSAGAYKVADQAGSLDGAPVVTASPSSIPSTINRLDIGNNHTGGLPINGHIKRLIYFNTRLSDDKLKSITT